ncbi:MAG: Tn3 family transposase, partial [Dermatophilaceae bacterium]
MAFIPGRATVNRAGYVFRVLELFHQRLRRRVIFALASGRWADPRAQLLAGSAWEAARGPVLNALQLLPGPDPLLAEHARDLDAALRHVAGRLIANPEVSIDEQGRLHAGKIDPVPDPPSLSDLRRRCEAMLPVDIGEVVLEVMSWQPEFAAAFTSASGGQERLADLGVSVAAGLTAHALDVGFTPVINPRRRGADAAPDQPRRPELPARGDLRRRERPAHHRPGRHSAGPGVGRWAARCGRRRPIRRAGAQHRRRPNPRYFGRRRGVTLLNLVNDQAVGLAGQVVSGTPRDSLHVIDLIYRQDGGRRPEVIISDTGSYSDMVCGLMRLLGFDYRPQLADLPDAKLWRINPGADYGPLTTAGRGKIDLGRVRAHWPDLLRLAGSIHTGAVSAHDVLRMLAHGGNPTQLGEALAHYGRADLQDPARAVACRSGPV